VGSRAQGSLATGSSPDQPVLHLLHHPGTADPGSGIKDGASRQKKKGILRRSWHAVLALALERGKPYVVFLKFKASGSSVIQSQRSRCSCVKTGKLKPASGGDHGAM